MKTGLKIGDWITCTIPVETYQGKPFVPGNKAIIKAFPAKVRITKGLGKDNRDYFVFCELPEPKNIFRDCIALNVVNCVKVR